MPYYGLARSTKGYGYIVIGYTWREIRDGVPLSKTYGVQSIVEEEKTRMPPETREFWANLPATAMRVAILVGKNKTEVERLIAERSAATRDNPRRRRPKPEPRGRHS